MEEQDKSTVIPLDKPLADAGGKLVWESIALHEPALVEVNQFLEKQKADGALAAMGLLISLLSGIPPLVVKRMPFTTFKQCEVFLLTFLNYVPEPITQVESTTVIVLPKALQDGKGEQNWAGIDLVEPCLDQVDQFYKTQTVKGGLVAMSTLIAEISGIPAQVINRLPFTDYKRCEGYMLGFLNFSPTTGGGASE
ncbi:phage tail assembly protein [Rouxiella badensis]|uniref:phage tail assembly protein n=1 Tax=Rouxiella badensis TaxID=1646377 RepID=UPI0013EF3F50|nr:phage tail assembly protein [Rouxiella badensis]QII37514.1 phage tail assembly protein [Rouxiella badensis]